MKKSVLFLCTGNSARSQMAEGLLRAMAGDRFEVFSAGTHPKGLHPETVATMKDQGIDVSAHTSKNVRQFEGQTFDTVITVCDNAKENCPYFPAATVLHWSFDDPADASPGEQPAVFRRVCGEIRERLRRFLA